MTADIRYIDDMTIDRTAGWTLPAGVTATYLAAPVADAVALGEREFQCIKFSIPAGNIGNIISLPVANWQESPTLVPANKPLNMPWMRSSLAGQVVTAQVTCATTSATKAITFPNAAQWWIEFIECDVVVGAVVSFDLIINDDSAFDLYLGIATYGDESIVLTVSNYNTPQTGKIFYSATSGSGFTVGTTEYDGCVYYAKVSDNYQIFFNCGGIHKAPFSHCNIGSTKHYWSPIGVASATLPNYSKITSSATANKASGSTRAWITHGYSTATYTCLWLNIWNGSGAFGLGAIQEHLDIFSFGGTYKGGFYGTAYNNHGSWNLDYSQLSDVNYYGGYTALNPRYWGWAQFGQDLNFYGTNVASIVTDVIYCTFYLKRCSFSTVAPPTACFTQASGAGLMRVEWYCDDTLGLVVNSATLLATGTFNWCRIFRGVYLQSSPAASSKTVILKSADTIATKWQATVPDYVQMNYGTTDGGGLCSMYFLWCINCYYTNSMWYYYSDATHLTKVYVIDETTKALLNDPAVDSFDASNGIGTPASPVSITINPFAIKVNGVPIGNIKSVG